MLPIMPDIRKLLAVSIIIFSSIFSVVATGDVFKAYPGTPLFEKPDSLSRIVKVVEKERDFEVLEKKTVFLSKNPVVPWKEHHPLTLYVDFYRVKDDTGEFWVSPSFIYYEKEKTALCVPTPRYSYGFAGFIFLAVSLCAGYSAVCLYFLRRPLFPRYAGPLGLLFIIMLRSAFLAFIIYNAGNIVNLPFDEPGYFKVGYDIAHGSMSKWIYTIGHGMIMIPFIIAGNAETYYEIAHEVSFFNAFIVYPACIALAYLILRKACMGMLKALTATAIFAFLPFFIYPAEGYAMNKFGMIVSLPDCFAGSYTLFNLYTVSGFNGMSDTTAMFFVLLSVMLSLYLDKRTYVFVIVPAIFSFACLIRINNIFFSPLIAYLLLGYPGKESMDLRSALKNIAIACGVFLIVFLPQLIINEKLYGAFYRFAYSLHGNRAHEGFAFTQLAFGIPFIFNCSFLYISLFAVSILLIKDKSLKTVLVLWAIPMLFFFCGYPENIGSPVRFIVSLFPAFTAAFVAAFPDNIRKSKWRTILLLSLALILLLTFPRSLQDYPYYFLYNCLSYAMFVFFAVLLVWTLFDIAFHSFLRRPKISDQDVMGTPDKT